jgi:predicted AAA+ superfamily ATPase
MIDSYLDALFDVSMKQSGKDPFASRRIAESLARGLGTTMGLGVISQDASQGTEGLYDSRTISSYLADMELNYFICDVPGWDAPVKSRSRIRKKPKRYFDDPSLAAALLGFDAGRLLEDGQTFGVLFENLVAHELRAFLSTRPEATSESLRYYGDADGLEVDFIIELRDGRWAAIEVKLGESKVDKAAESLTRLERKVLANPMARNPEPAFKAVVVGHADYAYRRDSDGVYVLPIGVLAP